MSALSQALDDLVIANRILASEQVVDAFGHVSVRHPEYPHRFIMSRSRAPELVERDDLMEFEADGSPIDPRGRSMYAERFIHAGIYEARPDVNAVVHNHSHALIPFSVTNTPLRPIFHMAGAMGAALAIWDIRDRFGDSDLLVTSMDQARDLASALGDARAILMRGHGCAVAAASIREVVKLSIYIQVNAHLLMDALRLGTPKYLSPGEIAILEGKSNSPLGLQRSWEYWAQRASKPT